MKKSISLSIKLKFKFTFDLIKNDKNLKIKLFWFITD